MFKKPFRCNVWIDPVNTMHVSLPEKYVCKSLKMGGKRRIKLLSKFCKVISRKVLKEYGTAEEYPCEIHTFEQHWWWNGRSLFWLYCIIIMIACPGRCAAFWGWLFSNCLSICFSLKGCHHRFLHSNLSFVRSWSLLHGYRFSTCLCNQENLDH